MLGMGVHRLRGTTRAILASWIAVVSLLLPAAAVAVPELVSWTHADTSQLSAFRIYVQAEGEPLAEVIEIPLAGVDPTQTVFGHFIARDPALFTWVTVVGVDSAGQESEAAWTRIFRPVGSSVLPCYADLDEDGYVSIVDLGFFKNAFGQTCGE